MKSRIRRVFRAIDARLILALVALIVAATICWGFVQRGQHISEAEASITDLSHQVGALVDENQRLHRQLQRNEEVAARRSRQAARERDALQRELLRLVNYLRENGIDVPLTGSRYEAPAATSGDTEMASTSQPAPAGQQSSQQGQSSPPSSGSGHQSSPGHSGGHSGGHSDGGTNVDVGPVHVHVDPPPNAPLP